MGFKFCMDDDFSVLPLAFLFWGGEGNNMRRSWGEMHCYDYQGNINKYKYKWFHFSETELDFRKRIFFAPSQQNHLMEIEIFTLSTSALPNYCIPLFNFLDRISN